LPDPSWSIPAKFASPICRVFARLPADGAELKVGKLAIISVIGFMIAAVLMLAEVDPLICWIKAGEER